MKLSNQALGALMLTLQKGLIEQIDVTDILRGLEFFETINGDLEVKNPPTFKIAQEAENA